MVQLKLGVSPIVPLNTDFFHFHGLCVKEQRLEPQQMIDGFGVDVFFLFQGVIFKFHLSFGRCKRMDLFVKKSVSNVLSFFNCIMDYVNKTPLESKM